MLWTVIPDHIFDPTATTADLYNKVVSPIVVEVTKGQSGIIKQALFILINREIQSDCSLE